MDYEQAGGLRRLVRRASATAPASWLLARTLHHVDRLVYRVTGGSSTFSSWVSGLPVVMLTTTGARSGRRRTIPVLGLPDGDGLVVIASNFGQRHHPAWYHNLRAHPRASVTVRGVTREVEAHELTGEEWERCFQRGVEIHPGWVRYRRRAANRRIPVIMLDPV
jgi:deazaflavin-dependent oxidoreductase (nitroreductase family)